MQDIFYAEAKKFDVSAGLLRNAPSFSSAMLR
jgi:hypothetical protein